MPPGLADAIGPVIAIISVGSFVLIGMKLRYTHLRETKNAPSGQERDRLTESIELLRDQVCELRDQMADVNERLDFAERALTAARLDERAPKPLMSGDP